MSTKKCFKCGLSKAICEFYEHSRMADGHLNKCKACTKTDVKANRDSRRLQYSAYEAERNDSPARRQAKIAYQKKHRELHPERARARAAVNNAVRLGRIRRQPCELCGKARTQAHHADYSRPLDVRWLCFKCHREAEHHQVVMSE